MRDRARCASQATEDWEAQLQQRRYRLAAERGQATAEKVQAGSREGTGWQLRLRRKERPGCSI